MLDIKFIRENVDAVRKSLSDRDVVVDIERLLSIDEEHRRLLTGIEEKRALRNANSQRVGELMRSIGQAKKVNSPTGEIESRAASLKEETAKIGDEIAQMEHGMRPIEDELRSLLLLVPNIPDASAPVGPDETYNVEIRKWGSPPEFPFPAVAHWDIGEELGIFDFERAAKIAQSRFSLYFGDGARLERSLINFMLDTHTNENGYLEVFPPILANEASLLGTGQLPKLAEDMFKCADDDLYLIPTAEVSVTNIHRDEILEAGELTKKYVAYTPCFRREAGAHGRETRGLIRQHQFNKVELVKFTEPEESAAEHEKLTADAEMVLKKLGLAYRVVSLATGDISFAASKCYDLEVWMPSMNGYKEISSCSNFTDFQARRANIRYRPEKGAKPRYVHTLNGSGLAIGRTVAAILENYQREDGSVIIPEPLRPYMGSEIIEKT